MPEQWGLGLLFATPSSVDSLLAHACCVYDVVFREDAVFTVYTKVERQPQPNKTILGHIQKVAVSRCKAALSIGGSAVGAQYKV